MAQLFRLGQHEDLGGGRMRSTIGIKPVNYLEGGSWKRIVSDWATGDENFPQVVTRGKLQVYAAPNGDRRICPTGEPDVWASISAPFVYNGSAWVQPSLGGFTRNGNVLTAENASVISTIVHAGHRVDAEFELKNGWVPINRQFAFRVGTNGLTRSKGVLLKDGIPVMHLQAPIVRDAANAEDVRAIAYEFVQFGGAWNILFTLPDLTGMTRPVMDPTLTLQPDAADGKDTMLASGNPIHNWGAADYFNAGGQWKGLIKFDISELPSAGIASSAVMTLYTIHEFATTDRLVSSHMALTEWFEGFKVSSWPSVGEDGSTWNLRNANGEVAWAGGAGGGSGNDYVALAFASTLITGVGNYYDWDLISVIDSWRTLNYGLWLLGTVDGKVFASSDHATAEYRPKLVVEYTLPSAANMVRAPGWGRW